MCDAVCNGNVKRNSDQQIERECHSQGQCERECRIGGGQRQPHRRGNRDIGSGGRKRDQYRGAANG